MFRIILVAAYVTASLLFGNWKKWKNYYSTYLFAVIGDLTYNFVFYEKSLWEYNKLISHTSSDFIMALIIFPCVITLFLNYSPDKVWKQSLYILGWTIINTVIEYVSYKLGFFSYFNGWNIFWSMGFYYIAFIMVRIHYVKPLLAWPISFALAFITMLLFNVPLSGFK